VNRIPAVEPSALQRAAALFMVRPGEGRRTGLLFAQLLLASAIFILGRTVRDTLFLSRFPVAYLPWMFVLYGVASAITVVVYSRFADRVARHRMIASWSAIGVASYLATWVLVQLGISAVYPVFYVWSEVFANLFIVQFWTLANDLHDARSAKRLFGTIGAARVLGVIVIGLGTGVLVRWIGTAQLLFVLAAMMVAVAWLARLLRNEPRPSSELRPRAARRRGPPVTRDPYVRALALMILFAFTALTVGDYQFKVIARATYREDALAAFFSWFYAGTGLLSFVFQLVVTPRLLKRFGVGLGMTVMPGVFGAASALLLLAPQLAVATAMKFADNGFQYTIHETTLQSLYVPFEASTKARTRALLDAVVKPCSYGAGGLVLIVAASRMEVAQLSIITSALVVLWLLVLPMVKRSYSRSLQATLSARGLSALEGADVLLDANARRALDAAMLEGDTRVVRAALAHLGPAEVGELRPTLEMLVGHADADVREKALELLRDAPDADAGTVRGALSDPESDVRAAAASCLAARLGDEAVDDLEPLLEDPARGVRVAALAGLMSRGGVDGDIRGASRLAQLLSGKASHRAEAARVLGRLGNDAYRPLVKLLHDPKPKVRRAALKACAGVADPRLTPLLIEMLDDPSCRGRASSALIAIGETAVPAMIELLTEPTTPRPLRMHLPRVLQGIATKRCYLRLLELTGIDDSRVRLRVFAALSQLRDAIGAPPLKLGRIRQWIEREVRENCRTLAEWQAIRTSYAGHLVDEQADYRHARSAERVLRLLELRYDRPTVRLARHRLRDPRHRANALEVLDTTLDPALRSLVMPLVDPSLSIEERLGAAGDLAQAPAPLPEVLAAACEHDNPYVAALILHRLTESNDPLALALAGGAIDHADPLVRELAASALVLGHAPDAERRLRPLLEDDDPVVRRHARQLIDRLASDRPEDHPVSSTIERILLLKSAPMFARVAGEDLVPLARVAEEVQYAAGEEIFAEGDTGTDLYLVLSGKVDVTRKGETVAELGAGEAFGEMAVLDEAPRSASATAAEDCELLRIGSEEFYEILHEQAEIAEGVIRVLTARLREATRELTRGGTPTIPPMSRY
jgi:HEAT repeat protein